MPHVIITPRPSEEREIDPNAKSRTDTWWFILEDARRLNVERVELLRPARRCLRFQTADGDDSEEEPLQPPLLIRSDLQRNALYLLSSHRVVYWWSRFQAGCRGRTIQGRFRLTTQDGQQVDWYLIWSRTTIILTLSAGNGGTQRQTSRTT